MTNQFAILKAIVSTHLRRVAESLDIDTSDAGFTTVEKVVLTAVAVTIAIAAGAAISGKVTGIIDKITGP